VALFLLFATQLFITNEQVRVVFAAAYTLLCIVLLLMNRASVPQTARSAWDIIRGRSAPEPPDEGPTGRREQTAT
jgi:hypothetical protein